MEVAWAFSSLLILRVRGPNAQVRAAHVVNFLASPITAGQSETNLRLGKRNIPNLESGIAQERVGRREIYCVGSDRTEVENKDNDRMKKTTWGRRKEEQVKQSQYADKIGN